MHTMKAEINKQTNFIDAKKIHIHYVEQIQMKYKIFMTIHK